MTDLNDIHGVLNLDKPPGLTSAVVVARVKRLLGGRAKVGHAGTLDSFATGVLLVLVGRATKRCEELMGAPKQYETTIRLGATTPTLDPLSPPEECIVTAPPGENEVIAALAARTGDVLQTPPLFSALKVSGRRASDRTRDGQALTLPPRAVRIDAIDLLEYAWPDLRVRIDCGRGTYVRAIARDVGQALGVGGYLTQLRRTRVGPFSADHAVRLDTLTPDDVVARLV